MFSKQLDRTKLLFDTQMRRRESRADRYIPVHRNQPAVAGQIEWCREVSNKIEKQFQLFKHPEKTLAFSHKHSSI